MPRHWVLEQTTAVGERGHTKARRPRRNTGQGPFQTQSDPGVEALADASAAAAEPNPARPARTRGDFEFCAFPLSNQMISRAVSPPPEYRGDPESKLASGRSARPAPDQMPHLNIVPPPPQMGVLSVKYEEQTFLAALCSPCNSVLPMHTETRHTAAQAQSLIAGPRSRGQRELSTRSTLGHVR